MKFIIGVALLGMSAAMLNAAGRREVAEWVRDLSDRVMMLLLRSTSGFARDVSSEVLAEERERQLRWRPAPVVPTEVEGSA